MFNWQATSLALIPAVLFVWYTRRKKALSPGGALTAGALGIWVIGWAGWIWLLPLFFFFGSGTLLSRLNRDGRLAADAKHDKPRDAVQVLCNGGIYGMLATFSHEPVAQLAMILTMAVSTADTWSSEIGMYFRHSTFDILRWRPVPPGLSGGISLPGSIAGWLGAGAIAVTGCLLLDDCPCWFWTWGGFAGMILDSLIGAGFQARYRLKDGELSDNPVSGSTLTSGFRWITNDGVNLLSNLTATLLVWLL